MNDNKSKKLRIAVDVDGVLGDQVTPILSRINTDQGLSLSKNDITQWKSPAGKRTIDVEIEDALLDEEYILTMPLIESSQEGLEKLSETNHIIIATNRPKQTESATLKWLCSNFKFHEFYNSRGIGKRSIHADILIDDYINNILEFSNDGRIGILFSQPWNIEHSCLECFIDEGKVCCCNGWDYVIKTIKRIKI